RVPSKSKPRSRTARGSGASPKRCRKSPRKSNARTRTAASTSSPAENIRVVPVEQRRIWVCSTGPRQGVLNRHAGGPVDQLQQPPLPVELVPARHVVRGFFRAEGMAVNGCGHFRHLADG